MATEKDIALAAYLLKLSQEGKLKWEPTARTDEFTASLRGKYNIVVSMCSVGFVGIRYEHDPKYSLRLVDENEQELVRMTETDYFEVVQLFELARRKSLNVDVVIDEILRAKEDELPF
jgi:hypothetical protein